MPETEIQLTIALTRAAEAWLLGEEGALWGPSTPPILSIACLPFLEPEFPFPLLPLLPPFVPDPPVAKPPVSGSVRFKNLDTAVLTGPFPNPSCELLDGSNDWVVAEEKEEEACVFCADWDDWRETEPEPANFLLLRDVDAGGAESDMFEDVSDV